MGGAILLRGLYHGQIDGCPADNGLYLAHTQGEKAHRLAFRLLPMGTAAGDNVRRVRLDSGAGIAAAGVFSHSRTADPARPD